MWCERVAALGGDVIGVGSEIGAAVVAVDGCFVAAVSIVMDWRVTSQKMVK